MRRARGGPAENSGYRLRRARGGPAENSGENVMRMIYLMYLGIIIFVLNIILNRLLHLMPQKTMLTIYIVAAVLIFVGIAGSVLL